jgi:hypothetical protein
MRRIIEIYGNPERRPGSFIFSILQENDNPMRRYTLVKELIFFINRCMRSVAKELGITKKVTNIVSRHTFSTVIEPGAAFFARVKEPFCHSIAGII